uniref:Sushi domain-containing protein n=1 Tax=Peromyscus maniculatus bairdii TaxID=230844 RepID=A0A8C8W4M5_PERMB
HKTSHSPPCLWMTCSKDSIEIENGFLSEFDRTYALNRKTLYRCKQGYVTANGETSGTITCLQNGWSAQPSCINKVGSSEKESCPPPPQIPNAQVMKTTVKYKDGEKVSVLCQDNYIIQDTEEMVCRDGRWQSLPRCIDCDNLPRFENAIPQEEEKYSYRSGEQVTFTCAPSYHMNGSNIVTCVNREWIGEVVCKGSLMHFQHVFIIVLED